MKRILTAIASLALLTLAFAQTPCGIPGVTVTVTVSPSSASSGDLIQITLTNNSGQLIQLPSSCTYQSVHPGPLCGGIAVFSPGCGGVITPIPPGSSHTTVWNQLDDNNQQVPNGTYSIGITYFDGGFNTFSCCPTLSILDVGTPTCFGVGCPCGNDDPTAGCANSTGMGGFLSGSGSNSASTDDLVLLGSQVPPSNTGLFYMGNALGDNPFFDGKQCALGTTLRFFNSIQITGVDGTMTFGPGIAGRSLGLIVPGTTWHFQAWLRDVGQGPCGTGANLTSAYSVSFTL